MKSCKENDRWANNLAFISNDGSGAVIYSDTVAICPLRKLVSGYTTGHSIESAPMKVQLDILTNMENQEVILLVLINLLAAFDTIVSTILLDVFKSRFWNLCH